MLTYEVNVEIENSIKWIQNKVSVMIICWFWNWWSPCSSLASSIRHCIIITAHILHGACVHLSALSFDPNRRPYLKTFVDFFQMSIRMKCCFSSHICDKIDIFCTFSTFFVHVISVSFFCSVLIIWKIAIGFFLLVFF